MLWVSWWCCEWVADAVLLKNWQDARSEFHTGDGEGRGIHVHFTQRRGHSWLGGDVPWGPQDAVEIRHCTAGLSSAYYHCSRFSTALVLIWTRHRISFVWNSEAEWLKHWSLTEWAWVQSHSHPHCQEGRASGQNLLRTPENSQFTHRHAQAFIVATEMIQNATFYLMDCWSMEKAVTCMSEGTRTLLWTSGK